MSVNSPVLAPPSCALVTLAWKSSPFVSPPSPNSVWSSSALPSAVLTSSAVLVSVCLARSLPTPLALDLICSPTLVIPRLANPDKGFTAPTTPTPLSSNVLPVSASFLPCAIMFCVLTPSAWFTASILALCCSTRLLIPSLYDCNSLTYLCR